MKKRKYICTDCSAKIDDYGDMATHVRTLHSREPHCGPTLKVGDMLKHEDKDVRVLEIFPDGRLKVQPILQSPRMFQFNVTARVWECTS